MTDSIIEVIDKRIKNLELGIWQAVRDKKSQEEIAVLDAKLLESRLERKMHSLNTEDWRYRA